MSNAITAFQQAQRQFLAYLREPAAQVVPDGVSRQRMSIYRQLLYNKFDESLTACFPVTQAMLGEAGWRSLLKAFIAKHQCLSPYYRQIPDEFIFYLQHERCEVDDPPYLAELAHFEWIELQLAIDQEEAINRDLPQATDWLDACPVFAPVRRLLQYLYPVHRIQPGFETTGIPENVTYIFAFRDAADAVQFIELNPAAARLVTICLEKGCTGGQALQQICVELNHQEPLVVFAFGVEILNELARQGAIIGTAKV